MSGNNLMIYRYDDSFLGKTFRFFRKSELPSVQSYIAFPNFWRTVWDITEENIYVLSKEEIKLFKNPFGDDWIPKTQYYVRHPKTKHQTLLIPANKFMAYTEKEKIAEMLFYILEHCKPKNSITITSLNASGFKANLGATITAPTEDGFEKGEDAKTLNIKADVGAHGNSSAVNSLFVDCSSLHGDFNKNNIDYVWIEEFPDLKAAVHTSNVFTIKQQIRNDFSLHGGINFVEHINLDFKVGSDERYDMLIEVN